MCYVGVDYRAHRALSTPNAECGAPRGGAHQASPTHEVQAF